MEGRRDNAGATLLSKKYLSGKRVALVGSLGYVDLSLMSALRQHGSRVVGICAATSSGLSTVCQAQPDLIILYVSRASLAEAIAACAELEHGCRACVVAVAHLVNEDGLQQLRHAGAEEVLTTPITAEQIIQELLDTPGRRAQ